LHGIERRFPRRLVNLLNVFNRKVDHCVHFMNDGEITIPVFEQTGDGRNIFHEIYYQQLLMEVKQ